jgi:hypothetical protein
MREKLRNMEVSAREDSWNRFEAYSDLNRSAHKASKLPSFQLNINRTLVLPFVFGGLIILFSLLLFNFISIKNKNVTASNRKTGIADSKPTPVKEKPQPVISAVVKEVKKDTVITPPSPTPTIVAATPTVMEKPAVVEKTPTPTVAAISSSSSAWIAVEPAKIYVSPNIASEVVSQASRNQQYTVTDETNYFVKVSFVKDGQSISGFIRKDYMRKPGQSISVPSQQNRTRKKAETLPSIQTPVMLSSGSEEEPQLK